VVLAARRRKSEANQAVPLSKSEQQKLKKLLDRA
jgi:hypothetical protein